MKSAGFVGPRAKELLQSSGLSAYVCGSPENVFYVTGYPSRHSGTNSAPFVLRNQYPSFAIISAEGEVTLIAWIAAVRDREFELKEVVPIMDRGSALEALASSVRGIVGAKGVVGVDEGLPALAYSALAKEEGYGILVNEALITSLRLQKSPEERRRILAGTEISEKAIESVRARLREGLTDLDVISMSKRAMLDFGADVWDHATVPVGDSNAEIPEGRSIKEGDVVGLDLGAIFAGYSSDTHRKFQLGGARPGAATMQRKLIEFVDKCGRMLTPGTKFPELYEYASSLYDEAGLSFVFPNAGHSIGIETEEANITFDSPWVVKEGMAINLELYAVSEDGNYMGLEDTYFVEEGLPKRVTKLPRELIGV
jgi:Xaa-Pro dipeptidase